jgi:long-chain acyl-CoA synthetase
VRDLIATFDEVERLAQAHSRRASTGAGTPDAGRHRADDLHLGLHRQAQGRDDFLPQHARRQPGIERLRLWRAHTTHLSYLPLCHVAEQMLTTFCPSTWARR